MLIDIKEPSLFVRERYERTPNFEPYRPRQAKEFKMSFTIKQMMIGSALLMSSGISLGIGIMQYLNQ